MPVHVEVGRRQRKVRQVEKRTVRLAEKLREAALVIIQKQDEIVQLDMHIEKDQRDFAETHAKLACIGRRSLP